MLSIILISCLGIIVYSNTFHSSFHFDDIRFIVNNPAIRNIYDLPDIWHYYHGRFLTFLSLAFNYHFNGTNVFGYHLLNLAVHLGSAILVWWLVRLTLCTPAMKGNTIGKHAGNIALFAGLIFVSHPVQIEAVTNIWQRAASMAALFYMASLCLYVKARLVQTKDSSSGIGRFFYIVSLISAVAAMFTKENTITLPLMILLYEFCFFSFKKTFDWKYLAPFFATLFIIPITSSIKTGTFNDFHGNLNRLGEVITPVRYFLTQIRVLVTYIRLVIVPVHQNFDYDYPVFKTIFDLSLLSSFLFLSAVFYSAIHFFSKYRLVSFGVFWFFLTLTIPESSFWPLGDVISEHRLYLPLAGYSIFLVSGVYYLLGKSSFKAMIIVLIMMVGFNSFLTYQRNKVWKDEFTLWGDTSRKSPHKARPYSYLGSAYLEQGNIDQAVSEYNKAIELDPNDVQTYNNRGNAYVKQGKYAQALADFNKAIDLTPSIADPYYNRGYVYARDGDFFKAILDYNKAIEINPEYVEAYANRGTVYAQEGRMEQALSDFNKAIEIGTANAQVYYNRGLIYGDQGNFTLAIADYNKAIENDPDYAAAYNNRAVACFQLRDYDNAWDNVQKAKDLGYTVSPGFISALSQASGRDQ